MSVAGKKRKRSTSSSSQSESCEAGREPAVRLTGTDLMCPICFDVFKEVYSTDCGHSFCFQCISTAVEQKQQCPVCKAAVPGASALHPNCSLNDVVAKYKSRASADKQAAQGSKSVADIIDRVTDLGQDELSIVLRVIAERSQIGAKKEEQVNTTVALNFLSEAIERKEKERVRINQEIEVLCADRERLTQKQRTQGDVGEVTQLVREVQAVVPTASPPTPSEGATAQLPPPPEHHALATQRSMRVQTNYDEILEHYFSIKLPFVGEAVEGEKGLDRFCGSLQSFTRFQGFRELATLTYGDSSSCCIVSSIEFDRDGEFFAVAGVTKKIQIFEYESVVRNAGFANHYPVHDMSCTAKLSCVAYNPYHKHQLVSSDYEGSVCVWDTNVGRRTHLYQEHNRRVWSVAYNPQEPALFASGSDDCTVKLWSTGQPSSIFSFSSRANICSVKFNPHNRYLLAYGSADHGVHYVDLRKPGKPLLELLGHKKAVSYVHFMGPDELVSASTDSEVKSWHTQQGTCLRTYRGHTNDKNFVGLTVTSEFIACGSENNALYVYAKQVSSPMLTYQFSTSNGLLGGTEEASQEPNKFVSAVNWRCKNNILLAANSQGYIKVLEMSH